LKENIDTGYIWIVEHTGCDKMALVIREESITPEAGKGELLGLPDERLITFTANKGDVTCSVKLFHKRPWEHHTKAKDSFEFPIKSLPSAFLDPNNYEEKVMILEGGGFLQDLDSMDLMEEEDLTNF
jgi:predicted secreted protein